MRTRVRFGGETLTIPRKFIDLLDFSHREESLIDEGAEPGASPGWEAHPHSDCSHLHSDRLHPQQEALHREAPRSLEHQFGSTWLLLIAMGFISAAFFFLGVNRPENLPDEFHAFAFVAGAVVLLVGGFWFHNTPELRNYAIGLLLVGVNLLYSGVWGLYIIYELVTLPQAGLLLLLVHILHNGLALGYRSPWLQYTAAFLAPGIFLLAALTFHLEGTLPLLAGLALAFGLAIWRDTVRDETAAERDPWYEIPAAGLAAPLGALLAGLVSGLGWLFPEAELALWAVAIGGTLVGTAGYLRWRDATITRLPWVAPWLARYSGPWLLASAALVGGLALLLPPTGGAAVALLWVWLQLAVNFRTRDWWEYLFPAAATLLAAAVLIEPRLAWAPAALLLAGMLEMLLRRVNQLARRTLMIAYPVMLTATLLRLDNWELTAALGTLYLAFAGLWLLRRETELALLAATPLALAGGWGHAPWIIAVPAVAGLALAHRFTHYRPFDRLVEPHNEFSTWLRHRPTLNGWNLTLFPTALLAGVAAFDSEPWPALLLLGFTAHHLWKPSAPGRLSLMCAVALTAAFPLVAGGASQGVLAVTLITATGLLLRHQQRAEPALLWAIVLAATLGYSLPDDGDYHLGWGATSAMLVLYLAFQSRFGATPATSLTMLLGLVLTLVGAWGWEPSAAMVVTLALVNAAAQLWHPPVAGRLGLVARPSAVALLVLLIWVLGYDDWLDWRQTWPAALVLLPLLVWRRDHDAYGGWTVTAAAWPLVPFAVTLGQEEAQLLLPGALALTAVGLLWRSRRVEGGVLVVSATALALSRVALEITNNDYRGEHFAETLGLVLLGIYVVAQMADRLPHRWWEALLLLLTLTLVGAAGTGLLALAAPLALLALGWRANDLLSAPVAYLLGLMVVINELADRTDIAAPYLITIGLAGMVVLGKINLYWGSGDPFSFGWITGGCLALLALPYLVQTSDISQERALLMATLAWMLIGLVLLEGGFGFRRHYLRLYGFLYLGFALVLLVYGGLQLGAAYFFGMILLYGLIALWISRSYFLGRGRADIDREAGRP